MEHLSLLLSSSDGASRGASLPQHGRTPVLSPQGKGIMGRDDVKMGNSPLGDLGIFMYSPPKEIGANIL